MNPKAAAKEEDIAAAIELWEERSSRLARHGVDYALPNAFKKVALKKMLVGKVKETYELWETEKLSFEELLRKTKELARARKLDTDVSRGKAGVAVGAQQQAQQAWEGQTVGDETHVNDINAMSGKKNWKGKGKGKAKGKGRSQTGRYRGPVFRAGGGC